MTKRDMANNFKFDDKRAIEFATDVTYDYYRKKKVFSLEEAILPETILPKGMELKSKEYANYLFLIDLANYRVKADDLFKGARTVWEDEDLRYIFEPEKVANAEYEELAKIIKKNLKHGHGIQISKRWIASAKTIADNYEGDSRKIAEGITDVMEFKKILENKLKYKRNGNGDKEKIENNFKGYGPKLSSLTALWFHKYGFAHFDNILDLELATDRHIIRESIGQKVIYNLEIGKEYNLDPIVNFLQRNWKRILKTKLTTNPIYVDEAFWLLGAYACNKKPCRQFCPSKKICKYTLDFGEPYQKRGKVKPIPVVKQAVVFDYDNNFPIL